MRAKTPPSLSYCKAEFCSAARKRFLFYNQRLTCCLGTPLLCHPTHNFPKAVSEILVGSFRSKDRQMQFYSGSPWYGKQRAAISHSLLCKHRSKCGQRVWWMKVEGVEYTGATTTSPSLNQGNCLSSLSSVYLNTSGEKLIVVYPPVSWLPQCNFQMKFLSADHTRYFSGPNIDLC